MTQPSACISVALGLLVATGASMGVARAADAASELRDGENWFVYGDFEQVVAHLKPLIEPKPLLARREDVVRALELLGLACFYLRREDDARRYFEQLVRQSPDHLLDPLTVPPPAIRFYEEIRARLSKELELQREAVKRQLEREAELRRQANIVIERVELRRNSRVLAVVPFGVGQFQNDDDLAGYLFLGAELATTSASVALWASVERLRNPSGRFDGRDVSRAQRLRTAQVVTGAAALGLFVAGAAHGLATFREESEIRKQRLGPTLTPDATGAALSFTTPW